MAKSDAERARAYRERKKLKEAGLLPEDPKPEPLDVPRMQSLADYVRSQGEEAEEAVEWMRSHVGLSVEYLATGEHTEKEIEWTHNVIDDLETALSTLTSLLSGYWVAEIDREIERLKQKELGDPAQRDATLDKIVRFTDMRKGLEKTYRLSLPNYDPGS
ncbi:hypothetical protein [Nitratireductor sp. StC3]|uniref:hypothetical protein n=1 Tax=Nitratireductor sp. StC3 TaxID=2126741 RepID=UPI000D0DFD36|nr:hypothetical protein [Nitratireductor sp. StC3]PSM18509.1 hypothetical protein C7T96_11750 [Nitratireductor sp. StC3]